MGKPQMIHPYYRWCLHMLRTRVAAGPPVSIECGAFWTLAIEGTACVFALVLTSAVAQCTLIHVCWSRRMTQLVSVQLCWNHMCRYMLNPNSSGFRTFISLFNGSETALKTCDSPKQVFVSPERYHPSPQRHSQPGTWFTQVCEQPPLLSRHSLISE